MKRDGRRPGLRGAVERLPVVVQRMVPFRRPIGRIEDRPLVEAGQRRSPPLQFTLRWKNSIHTPEAGLRFYRRRQSLGRPESKARVGPGQELCSHWPQRTPRNCPPALVGQITHAGITRSAQNQSADPCSIMIKTACAEKLIFRAVSIGSPQPAPPGKYFACPFLKIVIHCHLSRLDCRGASRPSRTLKRDAMDARGDARRASPARTAKSCGPASRR